MLMISDGLTVFDPEEFAADPENAEPPVEKRVKDNKETIGGN